MTKTVSLFTAIKTVWLKIMPKQADKKAIVSGVTKADKKAIVSGVTKADKKAIVSGVTKA